MLLLRPSYHLTIPLMILMSIPMGILSPSLPTLKLHFFHGNYSKTSLVSGVFDSIGVYTCLCVCVCVCVCSFLLFPFSELCCTPVMYFRRIFIVSNGGLVWQPL